MITLVFKVDDGRENNNENYLFKITTFQRCLYAICKNQDFLRFLRKKS